MACRFRTGAFRRLFFGFGVVFCFLLAPGSVVAQPDVDTSALKNRRAQSLVIQGMTQTYLKDHEEAIAYFQKALKFSPGQPTILLALADAEAARDNITSALYYARQAKEASPDEPHFSRRLAELQRTAGRLQKAAATYQTLLAEFPAYNDARLPLARLRRELNQTKEALNTYETYVDSTRHAKSEVYAEMLDLYAETGNQQRLERILQTLIDRRRNDRSYRERLVELYVNQKQYEEALSILEELVRETPGSPQLLTRLETLYNKVGRTSEAEALWDQFAEKTDDVDQLVARARSVVDKLQASQGTPDSSDVRAARELLNQALAQDSTHLGALDLLGSLHYQSGAYASAGRVLDRALQQNPRDPHRWHRAATAHLRAGHSTRAASLAEEGLLLFPGRTELLETLGFARIRLGDAETALSHFEEGLAETRKGARRQHALLHAGMGLAQDQVGNVDSARQALDTALALAPEEPIVLRAVARHLARREIELDRALDLARRAVKRHGSDSAAWGVLGLVQFKRGVHGEARSAFKKAVETGHASAAVYEDFGDLHRALGNDRRAQRYWREALDRRPSADSVRKKLDGIS
jgi:tetratricopeptide (TPR) repeat protein